MKNNQLASKRIVYSKINEIGGKAAIRKKNSPIIRKDEQIWINGKTPLNY